MRRLLPLVMLLVAGCATEVTRLPADLHPAQATQAHRYVVTTASQLRFDTGYSRTLGGGTELLEVGEIPEGQVLRPVNTVLTVEGRNVHEAYLVIKDRQVTGFYLPVEKAFSPLGQPSPIQIEERNKNP